MSNSLPTIDSLLDELEDVSNDPFESEVVIDALITAIYEEYPITASHGDYDLTTIAESLVKNCNAQKTLVERASAVQELIDLEMYQNEWNERLKSDLGDAITSFVGEFRSFRKK